MTYRWGTELVVLVGLPASGKSTWAKEQIKKKKDSQWISSDNIRIEYDYKVSNDKVFKIMWDRVQVAAKEGKQIIYDATNLSSKRRKYLIDEFTTFCEKNNIFYITKARVFLQPVEELYRRNSKRIGRERVPVDVMARMLRSFQMPAYWEGFDCVDVDENSEGELLPIENICLMSQDNPHHSLSLGTHMFKAGAFAIGEQKSVEIAALYHDVGKYWTKEFDDKGIAHYYNHENVGAYMVALHFLENGCLQEEDYYESIILINYHMRPYVWEKSEKAEEKDKKRFRIPLYLELYRLNKYDRLAH